MAERMHRSDVRKGTDVPYLSHVIQVAGLVLECGGTWEQAIGGLLHDVAEDAGGEAALAEVEAAFGIEVAMIVRENSDAIVEHGEEKPPWLERKMAYIEGVAEKSAGAALVSLCDKIHNARALATDCRIEGHGHWSRFNAGRDDALWYYGALLQAFQARDDQEPSLRRALAEFSEAVAALRAAAS